MTQRTSAETFEEYLPGKLIREHRAQSSRDVFVQILARRHVQENVIIPAVPEPFIVWILSGNAVVEERSPGEPWLANRVTAGDFFLTTAASPTEMRWHAGPDTPFVVMHVYMGVAMMQEYELREVSGARDDTLSALLEQIRQDCICKIHPAARLFRALRRRWQYI